jgi:OHCU decarboxylase
MSPPVSGRIKPPPSLMGRQAFVERFGGIYEHSPWVAERLWDLGLDGQHDLVEGLHDGLKSIVAVADEERKLALVCAHPDLAGKAAVAGELSTASASEQAGAGLDRCTREEFERFRALNDAYKEKFGFPFVIAVKGLDRAAILDAFERRLANTPEVEFAEALRQIDTIARLRLEALAGAQVKNPTPRPGQ